MGRPRSAPPSVATIVLPVDLTPVERLAPLADAWTQAQISHLAGTPPPDSPTAGLILAHLSRDLDLLEAPPPDPPADPTQAESEQDALVRRHRVDIAATRAIVMGLIGELDCATRNQPLLDVIAEVCAEPTIAGVDRLREQYARLISLPGRVEMALKLGNTLRALVPLERQAAGLADGYVDAATERARKAERAAPVTVIATSFDAIRGKFDAIMMKASRGP